MIKITFDGKPLRSGDLEKRLMKVAAEKIAAELHDRLSAIRHPETGEFPTVLVQGDSLDDMRLRVEGSPALLALVGDRLSDEERAMVSLRTVNPDEPPRAFLSFSWEDHDLAGKIAHSLQANGIDTWWAEWEIRAGNSLRQKIDEGLQGCTHFIVLLTPASIKKPWVNQEMDAGLVRKLNGQTRFICLRHELAPSQLPPLLSGMLSPEIGSDFASDMRKLVDDIHGLSRKPPLGPAPEATSLPSTGYSKAATAVAKVLVEQTETAVFGDPQRSTADLAAATGLSVEDVEDALHELRDLLNVNFDRVLPKDELFATFDEHFKEWSPTRDALRLAADLVNDESFPSSTAEIAERYGWPPRRINPAIAYLINRKLIRNSKVLGSSPWLSAWVQKNDATRRFVKSRS